MAAEKRVSIARQYSKRSQFAEFWRRLSQNKGAIVGLVVTVAIILLAIFADVIFDFDTQVAGYNVDAIKLKPCKEHPFGTDELGRDMFNRVLYGTKYSVSIAASVLAFSFAFGLPLGALCGYKGGLWDLLIMRVFNIIGSIPALLLGVIIVAAFGQSTPVLVIALGIGRIGGVAGITRTSVMTNRSADYLEAGRAIGLKESRIVFKHLLPNCMAPIIVDATLGMGGAIISCSSLSFLGIGVPKPHPEWGALLSGGRSQVGTYPHLTLFPGLAIMITVLALNLMGDGLRDALDPKLKK
ncbi:MAG: ABC transporter permease [Firmicutes bacterium]|nr:ABC transporter permease [Bacillota bacterium]